MMLGTNIPGMSYTQKYMGAVIGRDITLKEISEDTGRSNIFIHSKGESVPCVNTHDQVDIWVENCNTIVAMHVSRH